MKVIKGDKYVKPKNRAKHHLMRPPEQIKIDGGAWKIDQWLYEQKGKAEQDAIQHAAANPDRYFVAFVRLDMPRSSAPAHVWPSVINDTLLFEQPNQPSLDDVMATAKKAWGIADRIEVINFYEIEDQADYLAFLGDEAGWTVIDE